MTKRLALLGMLLFGTRLLFAGDVATFTNLGFSPDAKYFLFGEYGVTDSSKPYASLYGVNVADDKFLPGGVTHKSYDISLQPGQTGLGALFALFSSFVPVSNRYHIDHLDVGRDLYLLVDGAQAKPKLDFRDFLSGNEYSVVLNQNQYGKGTDVSASFSIDLTVKLPSGKTAHSVVGLPDFKRQGVLDYRIRRIVLGPDGKSLVFVIEKHETDANGYNVRYMVETARLAP